MSTTKHLSEKEIIEAIKYWLKEVHGLEACSYGYLWQDVGDPPLSGKNIQCRIEVK